MSACVFLIGASATRRHYAANTSTTVSSAAVNRKPRKGEWHKRLMISCCAYSISNIFLVASELEATLPANSLASQINNMFAHYAVQYRRALSSQPINEDESRETLAMDEGHGHSFQFHSKAIPQL